MQFDFPFSDYGQVFEKDYEINGANFTIQVLNVGPTDLGPTWLFKLLVKGRQIEGGPYHPKFERELSDENVANQLASFWGHTKMVQDAQEFEGTPEYEMHELAKKCAEFMHGYLMRFEGHTDYDIVAMFKSDEDWTVVLRPNYIPNRLFEFYKKTNMEEVEVHSYIEDNELSIKL